VHIPRRDPWNHHENGKIGEDNGKKEERAHQQQNDLRTRINEYTKSL
jgi:hypothetical protein